jgi:peptidylprolyl isomerase
MRFVALMAAVAATLVAVPAAAQKKPEPATPFKADAVKAGPDTVQALPTAPDPENTWVLDLSDGGRVLIRLRPDVAPKMVDRVKTLTREHFYDNTIFHRVQVVTAAEAASTGGGPFAIVQGGDPQGTGQGGPGYSYTGEAPPKGEKSPRGTLALANSGSLSTDGSQFFAVVQDWPTLPPQYTVFGTVVGADSFTALDRMIKAKGPDLGQGLGTSPNPAIQIISATVTEQ